MQILRTAELNDKQKAAVVRLWNNEYPAQLNYKGVNDLDNYLNNLTCKQHYLLTEEDDELCGWALLFEREGAYWFAIIVAGNRQGKGLGTMLLDELKQTMKPLYGWVTDHDNYLKNDGTVYLSPLRFYLKQGFTICDDVRLETEQLSAIKVEWHND